MDKIVGIANCEEPEFALGCYQGTFREGRNKKGIYCNHFTCVSWPCSYC